MKITTIFLLVTMTIAFMAFGCEAKNEEIQNFNEENQENQIIEKKDIIGSWLLVKVDSCRRYVYPNASTFRNNIANDAGVIEFYEDGNGVINSSIDILCANDEFEWDYSLATLNFKVENWQADAKVKVIDRDTLAFNIESCQPRIGITVWYEVTMTKQETPDI